MSKNVIGSLHPSNFPSEILVLLSGGLDSAACLKFYLDLGRPTSALFIDYEQAAAEREYIASKAIANHFNIELLNVSFNGLTNKKQGLINARNAFLLSAALMESPNNISTIALGVHSGTNYQDCSTDFILKMQMVYDLSATNPVHIAAPFIDWSKSDIWKYAINNDVPVNLTYSCELGLKSACGKCLSCLDMEALREYA